MKTMDYRETLRRQFDPSKKMEKNRVALHWGIAAPKFEDILLLENGHIVSKRERGVWRGRTTMGAGGWRLPS